ncbi:MAG: 5-dehydro-2-deoxygluconokinase [Alphaproteobacteria bacterium MarineAlpha5_Bin11]|nr:adenosine kinase [Pelagibacteraceae bacterium]PPR44573.1 MAG: 5-dehydro-2-deoxygluconokinase [Alphaproteobacteria bacterium MarineAlpha5_Bin11]PPR50869.1 MAG: 5-dehydro-2-deoxygluconokinase [Alphaproteobacteria bacterium MarineAlpha5_Bin10]|tara:strand:- start:3142 stop:4122 length:981 start_codon:yes stop_codon:yes gene_type:complete
MSDILKKDVVAIGNAMVDVLIKSNLGIIKGYGINHDSMNLIDENKKNTLHNENQIHKMVAAGSAGNTIVGISSFGGSGTFIGKISNDKIGKFFSEDIKNSGINFPLGISESPISTGCCTIFVEDNGTRTMCTFLGTGSLINDDDIKFEHIINHKITYLEGYLWDNKEAKSAMQKMIKIAKKDNQKIALTLSDKFCIDRHRDSFNELIKDHIDILFANEDEINSMFQLSEIEDSIERLKKMKIISAITRSEKGSVIISEGKDIRIEAAPVDKIVDTTGAGDYYAAGFLYGIANGKSLEESAKYGSIAASEIISHFGTRAEKQLSSLI